MAYILTVAQMRAAETRAIASGAVSGALLMERAGEGLVAAVFARWPELAVPSGGPSRRAAVLCGPGNNGGDGFVVARLLKALGWEVEVWFLGEVETLPADAALNLARWRQLGAVRPLEAIERLDCDLVVDALFGIGLSRPLTAPAFRALSLALMDARGGFGGGADDAPPGAFRDGRIVPPGAPRAGRIVSVDIASGLCAATGRSLKDAEGKGLQIKADLTVTFQGKKPGHLLEDGPYLSGEIRVVPLGLVLESDLALESDVETDRRYVFELEAPGVGFAKRERAHKFSHGHALVLAGGPGKGGAARLAARAALRIGAGLVTLAPPPSALQENAARLDAVMLKRVRDAGGLQAILEDTRINALLLGPGLGLSAREAELVAMGLGSKRPLVLDADALSLLARDPALIGALHGGCVLTPHGGEFARLCPDLAARLNEDRSYTRLDAAREASARLGAVLLLKGAESVIAAPDGKVTLHLAAGARAAPWLATAGSGDVLAGLIAGLIARGFDPYVAACSAVWLHVEAARDFGPGLIAEDLPEAIPGVLRRLGA